MYSYGPLHMAEQMQGDQLEPTYSSSVRMRGKALRTCRNQWMIGRGGKRGSRISVLMARQDDDDDIYESKYGSKSDSMKKAEKHNNSYRWIYCDVKSTLDISVLVRNIYENLIVFAYFLKDGRILLVTLKNSTFSNIFSRAIHVLNTFKLRTQYTRLYLYDVYILFAPVISTSIDRCVNYSDIKALMMVIETETFNVDFTWQ